MKVGSQSCQAYGSQRVPLVIYCLAPTGLCNPVLYPQVVEVEKVGVYISISTEFKDVKYDGNVGWGPIYSKFSTIAEYFRWCNADHLFALSLTPEGVT